MTKPKDKKKKRVVKRKKRHSGVRVKELLNEMGKTEKWLIDELKEKYKMNKYETKEVLNGKRQLKLTSNAIQFCFVLNVSLSTLFDREDNFFKSRGLLA